MLTILRLNKQLGILTIKWVQGNENAVQMLSNNLREIQKPTRVSMV